MPRRDLSLPLAIIATGIVLIGLLLLDWPAPAIRAQGDDPCSTTIYPNPDDRLICLQTQTALAVTSTPYPTSTPTNRPAPPPPTSGPEQNATIAPTPTRTPTVLATATARLAEATPTATNVVIVATQPRANSNGNADSTPTPTSIFEGLETLVCQPGSEVLLEGSARPTTPLLIFFNQRPVGGTLTRVDGRYRAPLRIGRERPGFYLVEVRERDGLALVRQLACAVPGGTPTPTLPSGQ